MLAGLVAGQKAPRHWSDAAASADFFDADFFDAKGDLESLFGIGGRIVQLDFRAAEHPGLHPGQCAQVLLRGESIGQLGALHPALQRELGLPACLVFELQLEAMRGRDLAKAQAPSRYPEVGRELAVLVGEQHRAGDIAQVARNAAGELLTGLRVLDVYRGDAVPKGLKSVALGLTWQHHSRTLGDSEIDREIDSVVKALQRGFDASLRN